MSRKPDPLLFACSEEVRAALDERRPLVALETSVLSQGLPEPHNHTSALSMDRAVRATGAVPAWTALEDGRLVVGLDADGLARFCDRSRATEKVARRDVPAVLASRRPGATTVSATLWTAAALGIDVMATGGIGGVHLDTGDVSADLAELARRPGLVVCAGPKSIVDPVATLERLEELGVLVVAYGTDLLPFFIVRDAGLTVDHRVDTPPACAALLNAHRAAGIDSAILLCQPLRADVALDDGLVAAAVADCQRRAERACVRGKAVTPFLLRALAEMTNGASLRANLQLLEANARLAAEIAVAAQG